MQSAKQRRTVFTVVEAHAPSDRRRSGHRHLVDAVPVVISAGQAKFGLRLSLPYDLGTDNR
jgi:hypothetical protein